MLKTRSSNPWLRAAVWEIRECGTLGRDLYSSRTWPYWWTPANDPRVFVVFLVALGIGLLYVVTHTTWLTLSLWIAVVWALLAAATAVVRRRHYLRLDIRLAVQSVTGGHQRRDPNEHQRHSKVKRPKLRWELGTATLKSGVVKVPGTWARGNPEKIDQLDQELRRRVAYHGNYALDWPVGQAVGRLRKVSPLPNRIDAQHTWNPAGRGVLLGVTESCHHPGHCPTHAAPTHDGLYWARWLQTDDPHMLAAGSTGLGKTTMLRWLIYSLILSARAEGHGVRIAGLDGKSAGNLAFLDGRKGTIGKEAANTPDEWVKVINAVKAEMTGRYEALRTWRKNAWRRDPDNYPKPIWDNEIILVVDELVDIANIAGDDVIGPLGEICRQGREAGCTVVCSVLRPDTVHSLPGLVRAQLTGRLLLGSIADATGARMVFEDDWRAARAIAGTGDGRIPGRGVVRLGSEMARVQIPWTHDPADDPADAALWLPDRFPEGVTDIAEARHDDAVQPTSIDPRERRRAAETLEKS